jgi:hypothetical protein
MTTAILLPAFCVARTWLAVTVVRVAFGIQDVHAHRQQERGVVLERRLHQVADERPHLPEAEALGERLDREEAHVEACVATFLPQVQAVGPRILDRVVVDDLVADLAAVVVVKVGCVRARDPVGVQEQGAPVDEVSRVADPVGQRGRTQGRRHAVTQRDDLLAARDVGRVALQGDAHHQPEVAHRVVEALRQGVLGACGQVVETPAGQDPEQVVVAGGPAPALCLAQLVGVLHAQVRVAPQLGADVR